MTTSSGRSTLTPAGPRPLRLAHRGDWRRAPENTLEALLAALEVPACDGVEFDVRLSRDGIPVLLHDETLARVQHRAAHVRDLPAAELARHGIPELAAVLRALPARAFLDVELKGDDHGEATAAVLRAARGEAPDRGVISSFEGATLAAMADRLPGWPRWLNAGDLAPATISLAVGLGCRGVSVLWGAITPATIRAARGAGLEVAAWTVRRRATFDRLARLGVVAACVEGAALDG
jgi:glycerophosphoryl diester phosphodiesterase